MHGNILFKLRELINIAVHANETNVGTNTNKDCVSKTKLKYQYRTEADTARIALPKWHCKTYQSTCVYRITWLKDSAIVARNTSRHGRDSRGPGAGAYLAGTEATDPAATRYQVN